MTTQIDPAESVETLDSHWRSIVAQYQKPSHMRSVWQLANTLLPYLGLWALMIWTIQYSYLLMLLEAIPAAGLLIRLFIISHDCGHGSFFKSMRANNMVGAFLGLLTCTPYYYWKHEHALHHASMGNLDRRGHGDIWTMTVKEYLAAPLRTRIGYRLYRNPIVMFLIGSFYVFMIEYRIPPRKGTDRDRLSVWRTNLALAIVVAVAAFTIGLKAFVLIQLPVFLMSAVAGVWLFYVQHQFEGVYWARDAEWNYVAGCMQGSSYYRLPKVLQWFTGNIGFHHIHHLSSKIPNYLLENCHKENAILQKVHQLSLWSSLKCLQYRLLDDESGMLLTFRELRKRRHQVET